MIIFHSCKKDQIDNLDLLFDEKILINNISGVTNEQLIEFFGVENTSELKTKGF